ncbi:MULTISPECIES: SRPBCC domain-containing protein [Exiguobacterium]|uniref:SRPBCC domain-containing protein n=1 Tax=Exiguobacterium TaxID=33986 RepID=UPI0004798685|nr:MULTISPECIES: SRPBCC domain-containing protein [Exiguobacterium]MCK2157266.1 SRPBCC domain-containing protein [Exiguobacterium sp. 17-1]
MNQAQEIQIQTVIQRPVAEVWTYWTEPEHIKAWNAASDDWHTTEATNDVQAGGRFSSHMAAKDGSVGFDFSGVYLEVILYEKLAYTIDDGRHVTILFTANGDETEVVETFEAESMNPPEMQQAGWQAILDRFKAYAEQH